MLWFVGVALCSVTIIRVWLKVLGKTLVMVLLCHSCECGWLKVPSLFRLLALLLYFSFSVATQKWADRTRKKAEKYQFRASDKFGMWATCRNELQHLTALEHSGYVTLRKQVQVRHRGLVLDTLHGF